MKTDRNNIVISAIWYERFLECSRTFGTVEFPRSVMRFYNSLLDIDNGDLAIYSKVKTYKEDVFDPLIENIVLEATFNTNDLNVIETERCIAVRDNIDRLFRVIIQTIQDSGIGWATGYDVKSYNINQD